MQLYAIIANTNVVAFYWLNIEFKKTNIKLTIFYFCQLYLFWGFFFQNKTVFSDMEPALHLANKVVRKIIKVDRVCQENCIILFTYCENDVTL